MFYSAESSRPLPTWSKDAGRPGDPKTDYELHLRDRFLAEKTPLHRVQRLVASKACRWWHSQQPRRPNSGKYADDRLADDHRLRATDHVVHDGLGRNSHQMINRRGQIGRVVWFLQRKRGRAV